MKSAAVPKVVGRVEQECDVNVGGVAASLFQAVGRLYASSKSVLKLATIRVYDAYFSLRMKWYSSTGMTAHGVVRQISSRGIRGSDLLTSAARRDCAGGRVGGCQCRGGIGAAVDWARAASHRQGD
jgi:hypothetical protein